MVNARIKSKMTLVIKRVLNTLKERIGSQIKKIITDNGHYTKMASFAIFGTIVPMSLISVMATEDSGSYVGKINLDKSGKVLQISQSVPEIIPGESNFQKEQREKLEASEKLKSLAIKEKTKLAVNRSSYNDPASFDPIYQAAGNLYGIDWRILKSIHYVETGCSGSTYKTSYAGAVGPMQFIPSTWRAYGVDGNGDGIKDISNVEDAIYAAANYLRASGGSLNNYQKSLWSYNPSSRYYIKVMTVARSLGF